MADPGETRFYPAIWAKEQWPGLPVHRSVLTPLLMLERTLHAFPEQLGVVDGALRLTYGQFGARVYRLASALRRRGVGVGDRVAVLCRNASEVLEAHFAVPQLGAILVPINVRLSPNEIGAILDHAGASVLLLDRELAALVVPVRARLAGLRLIVPIDLSARHAVASLDLPPGLAGPEYEEMLAEGRPEPFVYPVLDEDDTISINYTSGTTGQPKGVMYTHRGAALNALGELLVTGMTQSSRYLWTLPMFHCNGWCFPWAVTAAGAVHVCLPRVEPARIFELIDHEGVTHLCGAPTVLIMLAGERPTPDYRFPHSISILTAAAPPPPAVIQRMEEMGARITHVYGLTETYGPHTVCEWKPAWDAAPIEERARIKARQGVGYPHAPELRVVDDAMRDVPADAATLGEVVMRGNNVMKGYYRDPATTAEAFRGGWFHSGDLAVLHPDGYIELRDRKKDIIISGGENISTIEVERVLYQHPAVVEAAVVGLPDERWGEVPVAFVTLQPNATATADDLIAFCRQHLARFKCPKAVHFGPLPKTSTGKVQKHVLRATSSQSSDVSSQTLVGETPSP
jgi:fatty-acyl-CoA synthase